MPSKPKVSCPNCGDHRVRLSRPGNFVEFIGEFLGSYCFRCLRCGNQFQFSVFGLSSWWYAKCPRCFRMDLTTWSESNYRPSVWIKFRTLLGARRVRCEACRCNFVSNRKKKEDYVRALVATSSSEADGELASQR